MTITETGFKISTPKGILTVGRDYLIRRGFHGYSVARFEGIITSGSKYARDHFMFKSHRTGRILTLKSVSPIL